MGQGQVRLRGWAACVCRPLWRRWRNVADRLLFVECAMLKLGTPYNPEIAHAKPA